MGAFTSRFSLYKPGGGSTGLIVPDEILDIDKLNSNFDIIDANLGAFIATSTTLPGVPKVGQLVFETDTKRLRVYSGGSFVAPATERGSLTMYTGTNLAALDAIADGVIGDTFYMTDPGLGNAGTGTVDSMTWEAVGDSGVNLNWRIRDILVVDTKAHLDTFVAAVAAIAGTDAEFRIGNFAFVTATSTLYRFTSIAGVYQLQDDKIIVPTSIAGSGAVLNSLTGLITCTAVTSVAYNGAYVSDGSGIDDYELVTLKTGASVNNALLLRNRLAGTDAVTLYDSVVASSNNAVGTFGTTVAGTSFGINGGVAVIEDDTIRIKQPALAAPTLFQSFSFITPNPATAALSALQTKGGMHDAATAYDGGSITTTSGTFTGIMYLRRKK